MKRIYQLIEESIKLELHVADLYRIFSKISPQDFDFWMELVLEEEQHASLIKAASDALLARGMFPSELLSATLQKLSETNNRLMSLLKGYKQSTPSREVAFNTALELEHSAGELHFQRAMEKEPDSECMKLFQQLTGYDKDHARRILTYMSEKKIQ